MSITVNMWSDKNGEIKRFLESFHNKDNMIEDDVKKYIYTYRKPVQAVDIISALLDNNEKFQIGMFIELSDGDEYHITSKNHNSVIRDIIHLFYES